MRARPARQVHEHGFRVVGGGVRRGDPPQRAALLLQNGAKERIAHTAAAVLQAEALFPRERGHIGAKAAEGNAALGAEPPRRRLVRVRLLPAQAVVDVGGDQHDAVPGTVRIKEMGKRRGIGTPRKTGHNGTAWREHAIPGDYPFNLFLRFPHSGFPRLTGHGGQPPAP